MKKWILIISILLGLPAWAAAPGKTVSKASIAATLSECRSYAGAHLVHLGRIKTAALKGAIRLAAIDNPDAREALRLMDGIRGLTLLEYEDCSSVDKTLISQKIDRALSGSEVLMEARDGGEKMQLYGVLDDKLDTVRDFVLFSPSDCALICLFGTLSMDTLMRIASDD